MSSKKKNQKKTAKKNTRRTVNTTFSTPLFSKMQAPASSLKNKNQALQSELKQLKQEFNTLYRNGNMDAAVKLAHKAHDMLPTQAGPLSDIAACYLHLNQFENAVEYAQKTLSIKPNDLTSLDALAHSYGELDRYDDAAKYGLQALNLRQEMMLPAIKSSNSLTKKIVFEAPSLNTKDKNIISFSLFGSLPKYCETAVLNAEAARTIYPHWTARFYVDANVPKHVKSRLKQYDAQVIEVQSPESELNGTMWRFLALDDDVHRVIFRDADALIESSEAKAVDAWVASGKHFHMLRDSYSHTELILAGMWGAVSGALTQNQSLANQMFSFHKNFKRWTRFEDQYFLREQVWPTAFHSLLQHDRCFGFLDADPLPELPVGTHRIGGDVSNSVITLNSKAHDKIIKWQLLDKDQNVFAIYESAAVKGTAKVQIARDIALKIQAGEVTVNVLST